MPEVRFTVRWPDNSIDRCYSPSTIIREHIGPEHDYLLDDFLARCRSGFAAASERVRQRYGGSGCARAQAQLAFIETKVAMLRDPSGESVVRVEVFES